MGKLLYKDLRLALHPTCILFLALSAMLMIPNYPYYVTFFYTGLGIFFVCLNGREMHDIEFSLTLPVRKRDVVTARFCMALLIEAAQFILAVLFALLRNAVMPDMLNEAGIEANVAFFGFSLILMGLFNFSFFRRYYRDPDKVGKVFAWASVIVFLYIILAEVANFALPFCRDVLDTQDPQFLGEKLAVLGLGAVIFAALTLISHRLSVRSFEKLDL